MELTARSLKKIASILRNAEKEFVKYGFNKVTMDGVASKANVSKVTLYKYFKDKHILYEEILKSNYLKEFDKIKEIIESDSDFNVKIDNIIKTRLEKYYDKGRLIVEKDYMQSEELILFMRGKASEMEELNHTLYEEGKQQGLIRKDLTDETLSFYFSIIRSGLVQNFTSLQDLKSEDLTVLLEVLYAGVLGCKIQNKRD